MTDTFKGFVQPTKNYFPVPNEWIDICAEIDNLAELKVIQYVLRHTWGFQEFGITKTISTDEFMHGRKRTDGTRIDNGTGLKSDRSVKDGLKNAIKHGYLVYEVDATDKARTKKSYALKMQAPVDGYILPPQIGQVDTTPLVGSIYLSGVQNLPIGGTKSTYRSEKHTLETHLKKDTVEKQEDASAIASAARTPFSSQQPQAEPIRIATSEQEDGEKVGQNEHTDLASHSSHHQHSAEPHRHRIENVGLGAQPQGVTHENNSHSHGEVTQANSVGVVPHGRAKAVPPDEQKTPPKPRRTPPVHKDGVPTPERIEQVFVCMEGTIRRLTEQEDFTFGRTKKAKEAIKDLLQGRSVSQEKMDWHIVRLWHKPKDTKSGFWWRENMSVVAICNNYDREIVNYKPGAPGGASAGTEKPRPTALVSEEQARKNIDKMRQRVAAMQAAAAAK